MKHLSHLSIFATLLLFGTSMACTAQNVTPSPAPLESRDLPEPSKAGDVVLLIQQTDISPESKHVDVVYENGSTVIRGTVANDRDRQIIGSLAEKCGCTNIKNELKVKQSPKKLASPNRTIKVR